MTDIVKDHLGNFTKKVRHVNALQMDMIKTGITGKQIRDINSKLMFAVLCQQSFSLASELKEPYDQTKIAEINTKLNDAFLYALKLLNEYDSKDFVDIKDKDKDCDKTKCGEILQAINTWITTLTPEQQQQKQVQSVKDKIDGALKPSTSSVASTSGSQVQTQAPQPTKSTKS